MCPWKANGVPPRVKSNGSSPGRKSGLAGSLKLGIGDAELKSFGQERVRDLHPKLGVVSPFDIGQIRLKPNVIQSA